VRSGVLLTAASGVSIVAAYVFLLAAGRILGSDDYGSLAALLGLLAVVLIPAGALQMAVSREISRRVASGDEAGASTLGQTVLRLALIATAPLLALGLALAAPLADLLHIHSVGIVVLAVLTLSTALVFPAAMGVLQGQQRFHALATLYVFPWVVRLVFLGVAASIGYRLGGAIFATLAGAIFSTALVVALIREPLHVAGRLPRQELVYFLRYLTPVAAGLVGIALLTHVDILVVRARFSGDDAGAYAAASAFARVGFFLPAAILAVLFPRTAARHARGEATEDILGRSLLATLAFCGALAIFYAAAGVGLIVTTFGTDFAEGGRVLAPFALAIGLFSVANVLVGYHLSRGETRYAWIVAAGVVAQVAALAVIPSTLSGVVWTNVVIGAALIVAHEALVGSSVPAIRAGLGRAEGVTTRVRAVLPEATVVLLGSTAFVCALFWPVVEHFGSTIIGSPGSDSTGTVAGLWQTRHEGGYHLLGMTHHTLSGAPFGWSETNALNAQTFLTYYPTYLAAHVIGDVAAYNLITLAGYVLSGATMYAFVRYLGCARLVAAWAALAYIVFPYHLVHREHASLLHLEVLVVLLFALVAAFHRPSWLRLAFVGAANLACWLASGYFGPMALVTTAAFTIGAAVASNRGHRLRLVVGSTACGVAAAGLIGLAAVVSGTNGGAGLERSVQDLSVFGIRPLDLVVPPLDNLVLGDRLKSFWATHIHGSNTAEITNYVGLLTLLLAATWLVVAVRRRAALRAKDALAPTTGLAVAFVAGLAFAAPSPTLGVPMPSRLLWAVVPAFRVLSRWDFLLMTVLLPLAALGLQAVWSRLALAGRRPVAAVAVVGAAMVVSFFELAIHPARPRFRTVPLPAEYAALTQTPRGILAEYPLGYSDLYRLWQVRHGRPLLNGAPTDTDANSARLMLLDPTQAGTAQALALLGVTAIEIHPYPFVEAEVAPREPKPADGYTLVGRYPDGASVWDVVASPAPAFVTLPGGFGTPQRADDGVVRYPFVGDVGVIELAAREPRVIRLVFDAVVSEGGASVLRLSDGQAEQASTVKGPAEVSVVVAIPGGRSRLLVKSDSAALIDVSAPRAEAASGEPTLHAQPISSNPGF
jgi:O-antigen/teichoic acid export membrane protein